MSFGNFKKQNNQISTSKFDTIAAKFLFRKLSEQDVLNNVSLTTWIKSFTKLRRRIEDKLRIKHVLKWYVKHHREKYVPLIQSAAGFCKRFDEIEVAMLREQEHPNNVSSIKITKRARDISEELMIEWAEPELKDEELATIQRSLDNYIDYKRRLIAVFTIWYPRAPHGGVPKGIDFNPTNWVKPLLGFDGTEVMWNNFDAGPYHEVIPTIDPNRLSCVNDFITAWIGNTAVMIMNWGERWNGKMLPHVFHYRSKKYEPLACELISEAGYSFKHWKQFIELLDKEVPNGESRKKGRKRRTNNTHRNDC